MTQPSTGSRNTGSKNSADAVRRILTTAGITGAALTLSAAAALPALACHGGGNGDDSASQDKAATKTSAQGNDKADSDKADSDKDKSDKGDKDKSESHPSGANTDDGHNPPGNNGTVKIHQSAGDSSPHNQPHVTCSFYVSFFGFDKDQTLNIAFTGQAPTGKGTPITITDASKRSLTSTTDAGGAGNDYDGDQGAFSASNLDLSGITPVKQGYHIKLDVSTGQGGGHKYKVFWLTPCAGTPGGTTGGETGGTTGGTTGSTTGSETGGTTGGTTGSETGGTTVGATGGTTAGGVVAGETSGQGTSAGASVLGESFTKAPAGSPSTSVLGSSVLGTSASRSSSSGLDALPFTGAETGALSALGLAALGGGVALTVAGRRRRRAAQM